jgi:protein O-GlcNAc transferase
VLFRSAFADTLVSDARTRQLRACTDQWRTIAGLRDQQVADQIRQARIDILLDLTLHMANNRLRVFARKPAPVQATFAGYPGSTGLSAIDYRLSDPYLDPPGMDESVYSEHTIRLPDSFWCYAPLEGREIPVNSLPALESGVVTFGCLNNFCKINESVLALWARVLRKVEGSRLLLLAPENDHRRRTANWLRQEGIDSQRVEFVPRQSRLQYLGVYHRIDLGLDSFPYNGHTTSLDSFWMGVPVVTLVGQTAVSRAGWSQLSNLGLRDLAAQTPEQFVQIAADLANDLPRLAELRRTLRQRMEASPLADAPRFARSIEAAYRQMWRQWCVAAATR